MRQRQERLRPQWPKRYAALPARSTLWPSIDISYLDILLFYFTSKAYRCFQKLTPNCVNFVWLAVSFCSAFAGYTIHSLTSWCWHLIFNCSHSHNVVLHGLTTSLKTAWPLIHQLWRTVNLGFMRPGDLDLWPFGLKIIPQVLLVAANMRSSLEFSHFVCVL